MERDRIEDVESKLQEQTDAIEQLRLAVQDVLSLHTQTISEEAESDDGEETLDLHIGVPTSKQLQMINELIGTESSADEWLVVPFQASNCTIDYSLRRWHPSTTLQLAMTAIGRPILLDHLWGDSRASVGTIFDSKIIIDSTAPEDVIKAGGYEEYNREIVEQEGYQWLYLCAAIARNSEAAEGILTRRHQDCSTGSVLSEPFMICPDCTKEHGREVSFYEQTRDAKGKAAFTCNHLIPSKWMLDMVAMYGEDGEEFNFARYCTLGGMRNEMIETSLCNRGALPAASIIRQS
jgi:hypothetical protein